MKNIIKMLAVSCSICCSFLSVSAYADQQAWSDYYQIERVDYPTEIDPQIGGVAAMQDGRIALAIHSGEIVIFDPKNNTWSTFAVGLHEPLGIVQESENTFVVMQKPELTRISDTNGDGKADSYRVLYDDFGMTGNYHEFAFGPAVDSKGNYYISLNVASNFAGVFEHIRGDYSDKCNPKSEMQKYHDKQKWIKGYRKQVTRMFSCAPYRGWIIKVTPDGQATPYSAGYRSPAGLHVDANDKLWTTDNQGDWIATSPLIQVNQGDFGGHPAGLNWLAGYKKAHKDIKPDDIKAKRKSPAGLFPQGELANSPTQPLTTSGHQAFGLPEGELLIGDMNTDHLLRFIPDDVGGNTQGTLIPFIAGEDLGIGNFRLDFDKNSNLWIGKIHLGWAGDEGLLKITRTNKPMFIVDQVSLVKDGFEISFNQPIASLPSNVAVTSHTYHYHKAYGSPKVDLKAVDVEVQKVKGKRNTIKISAKTLETDRLYTLDLGKFSDTAGRPLMGNVLRYTVNALK
ncbi:hypothetical protein C2869_04120 [Saccharobesus litoralis]|uniref:DUF7133 domain-containing protein n=1 Tax=Saccharobesus litoralis TaxID=2172099 RepID=A0A2S0VNB6_9ALTE|nr:hypothetical protein [Saccharobesus litoralis]AWB65672.1 hypothetical protein C2869_04120 [Saccharobesus litoralis]